MTKVDVCNLALGMLGRIERITTIDDNTDVAKRCKALYPIVARRVLRAHEWQDAIEYDLLTYESNAQNERNDVYEYIFDKPSDALRILDLGFDREANRLVEGSYIYTNVYDVTQEEYTVAVVTATTIQASAAISSDAPTAGHARVMLTSTSGYTFAYTGISGDTLTGVTPDPTGVSGLDVGDALYVATDGVTLRYIKDIREESGGVVLYGDHVADAIAAALAERLAPALAKDFVALSREQARITLIEAIGEETEETYHLSDGDTWIDEVQ